jgi:hypothetical protein
MGREKGLKEGISMNQFARFSVLYNNALIYENASMNGGLDKSGADAKTSRKIQRGVCLMQANQVSQVEKKKKKKKKKKKLEYFSVLMLEEIREKRKNRYFIL